MFFSSSAMQLLFSFFLTSMKKSTSCISRYGLCVTPTRPLWENRRAVTESLRLGSSVTLNWSLSRCDPAKRRMCLCEWWLTASDSVQAFLIPASRWFEDTLWQSDELFSIGCSPGTKPRDGMKMMWVIEIKEWPLATKNNLPSLLCFWAQHGHSTIPTCLWEMI